MWNSLAQRGHAARPVGRHAHRVAETGFALQHVECAGHPGGRRQRRGDTGLGSAPRVQRLGHRVAAKGLLQPRRAGGRRGQRVREPRGVEFEHFGRSGRGAETTDGAGAVPEGVVHAAHGRADAGGHLVADDHRAQQRQPRQPTCLHQGQGCRDRRCARVVDRIAKDVVHLGGVRGGAVDQRRGAGRGVLAERQSRRAVADLVAERAFQQRGRRQHRAGQHGRMPIDERALGVVQQPRCDLARTKVLREAGRLFDHVQLSRRRAAAKPTGRRCGRQRTWLSVRRATSQCLTPPSHRTRARRAATCRTRAARTARTARACRRPDRRLP